MPTDPYDDLFKNLAKAIEDLFTNLSHDEPARIIGCTIISGSADSSVLEDEEGSDDDGSFDYELIDGPECIYITGEIPPHSDNLPVVKIMPSSVSISVDGDETEIELPIEVQKDDSRSVIKNGMLDIVCRKVLNENNPEV